MASGLLRPESQLKPFRHFELQACARAIGGSFLLLTWRAKKTSLCKL